MNLSDLDLLSIAKQHEDIYKPGKASPYILAQDSPVLQLLRHIRDEAHRFAIQYYRRLHQKEMRWSEIDEIRGVGGKRKIALMKHFKDINMLRNASIEDLYSVKGISKSAARTIQRFFT